MIVRSRIPLCIGSARANGCFPASRCCSACAARRSRGATSGARARSRPKSRSTRPSTVTRRAMCSSRAPGRWRVRCFCARSSRPISRGGSSRRAEDDDRDDAATALRSLVDRPMRSFGTACTQTQQASQTLVERGAYLAKAADCAGCHTAAPKNGQPDPRPFAGGLPMGSPFGSGPATSRRMRSTASASTAMTISRALREGIARSGKHLYPGRIRRSRRSTMTTCSPPLRLLHARRAASERSRA